MLGGDNMNEEKFLIETGADLTAIAPNEKPDEELLYEWDGEIINEQMRLYMLSTVLFLNTFTKDEKRLTYFSL